MSHLKKLVSDKKKQLSLFVEDEHETADTQKRSGYRKKTHTNTQLTFQLVPLPEDQNGNFCDLKQLRERWNYSIDEVHEYTKIPIKHLIALESGERNFLPPIHVRAFLRTLAELYGVDWKLLNPPEASLPPLPEIRTLDEIGFETPKPTFWQSFLLFVLSVPKKIKRKFSAKEK